MNGCALNLEPIRKLDRKRILLKNLDANGLGLEIGPSHSPIAPRREGFNVRILDRMDRDGLVSEYQGHGVEIEAIEFVDYVWEGQPYADLVGGECLFDWILASHVIEHTPDLIGFLNDCQRVLKNDGVLVLAIPDKRFCFDRFRPISGLAQVVDAHWARKSRHSPGVIAEYLLNVISKGGKIAWEPGESGEISFIHSIDAAREAMDKAIRSGEDMDLHSWCFVPSSFRLLLKDISALGLCQLHEHSFESGDGEFFVTLSKRAPTREIGREELLRAIEEELKSF